MDLEKDLLENPRLGDPYGKNIYKVRISDESKGKGKSGGFRFVTYVVDESDEGKSIYLITILDKSEDNTIKNAAVLKLLEQCGL